MIDAPTKYNLKGIVDFDLFLYLFHESLVSRKTYYFINFYFKEKWQLSLLYVLLMSLHNGGAGMKYY